jgi:hypothetical protein
MADPSHVTDNGAMSFLFSCSFMLPKNGKSRFADALENSIFKKITGGLIRPASHILIGASLAMAGFAKIW